jgi:hypothetical protein
LREGRKTYFRVKARNVLGESDWSDAGFTTPDATAPYIYLAGYFDTFITASSGGTLSVAALVQDNIGVSEVELYYNGEPQGLFLDDIGDDVFLTNFGAIQPGQAGAGRYTFEMIARDRAGNTSKLWPYFVIDGPGTRNKSKAHGKGQLSQEILNQLMMKSGIQLNDPTKNEMTRKSILSWQRAYKKAVNGTRAAAGAPLIYAAGYWDSEVNTDTGGNFTMVAAVMSPSGTPMQSVDMYFGGDPTNVSLLDDGNNGDMAAGDSLYTFSQTLGPLDASAADSYLLEISATDTSGLTSDLWPYLTIGD